MKLGKITHVAILWRGTVYSLPAPYRHHHVMMEIVRLTGTDSVDDVQGFLDDDGHFLDREQALINALLNGQVKDPSQIRAGELFSEDLW